MVISRLLPMPPKAEAGVESGERQEEVPSSSR